MSRIALMSVALLLLAGVAAFWAFVLYFYKQRVLIIFGLAKPAKKDEVSLKETGHHEAEVVGQRMSEASGNDSAGGQAPMIVIASDDRNRGEIMQYEVVKAACNQWEPGGELGRGGAAVVFRGELPRYGAIAVKRCNPGTDRSNDFQREINALCQCRHPNILEIIGHASDGPEKLLVMPLMEGGTLARAVPQMLWSRRSVLSGQVVRAVAFLHGKKIVHRDIKTSNILLDRSLAQTRLADFGLAKDQVHSTKATTGIVVGSPGYMAPELMMRPANEKTDSYAMGVVLLETLTSGAAWDISGSMALTDRALSDGNFQFDLLDPRAAWPSEDSVIVSNQAANLTLFDPSRRRTVLEVERDHGYRDHLASAERADAAGGGMIA
eukprot:TRINITY_DN21851_c0_g1_i2.p1 TRINITY_DN21851_c0_g1~~TRINITY_DN21851_c0_g1_i2.p1  ORF type:complete len:396 (+),score=84.47 TRINITY_DN21851_c0_g1_i2:51-1190(+)